MKRHGVIALLLCCPLWAGAETAYVTDILRLGIHQARDTSDRPFENLVSGSELEVLERIPNFARVRTTDGREGWVKSAYLVVEKPAQLRVAEVEAEIERLRTDLSASQAAQDEAESIAERASREMAASSSSADAIEDTLLKLTEENASYEARLESYRGALPLAWVAGALVLVLAAGFIAGLWSLDAIIRKRHGGFRIY